jgi:Flp pilus assembly protein TadD
LLLVVVAAAPFLCVWPRQFVNWDDQSNVVANMPVRYPTWTNIGYLFSRGIGGNYIPLTWLSHALDWQLWGGDAWGHAATNVVWHVACCFLLVACLQRGGLSTTSAWLAGALFAVHPVHTEAVAWVCGRKDLLCAAALLACQYAYMGWREETRRSSWLWSVVWLIVAGLSKPMAMSAIVSLVLYDAVWLRRSAKETGKSLWPHAVICILVALVAVPAQQAASAIPEIPEDRRWGALDLVGTNLLYQMLRCWFPFPFSPYYPNYPSSLLADLSTAMRWSATLLLVAASILLAICWRRSRRAGYVDAALWWWFGALGFLLPVSGVIPLGSTSLADRYVYLPSTGPCIFVALGAGALARRNPRFAYSGIGAVIVGLAVVTHVQATAWRNSRALWLRTLETFPRSSVAWVSLTSAYHQGGNAPEALHAAVQGLNSDPDNLALAGFAISAWADLGRFDEAEKVLEAVEVAHPQAPETSFLRGKLAHIRRNDKLALEFLQTAISHRPDRSAAYLYLSHVQERLNDKAAAVEAARQAVVLSPADPTVRRRLIALLRKAGRKAEALHEAEELTAHCPHDAEGWSTLISLLKESERRAEVLQVAQKAARYVPPESLTGN